MTADIKNILGQLEVTMLVWSNLGELIFHTPAAREIMQNIVSDAEQYAALSEAAVHCIRTGERRMIEIGSICDCNRLEFIVSPLTCNDVTYAVMVPSAHARNGESELTDAEIQLKAILETSNDGIWIYNKEGKVINLSTASQIMCGLEKEQLLGKTVFELSEENLWDFAVVPEVLQTGRRASAMSSLTRTGKKALVTATPFFKKNNELSFVIVNERDITNLKLLEEELERAKGEIKAYREHMEEITMSEMGNFDIIAESESMRNILRIIYRIARMKASNILVIGETGTGKGILAKFYHYCSHRENVAPFIQINCAALPESLLESELFGYERGAFTGAREQGKIGLFELANGGTLFLDEIGEMPLALQSKILTYLDNNEILPLGAQRPKKVYCSIIAATNQDINDLIQAKKFRSDLYYRLNNFTISVPPLRDRVEDIFELANSFIKKYNQSYGQNKYISAKGIKFLQRYHFPGNIRELQNIIKRAVVLSHEENLDNFIISILAPINVKHPFAMGEADSSNPLHERMDHLEYSILKKAVETGATTREMARRLGISQSSIVRKLRKYGLGQRKAHRNQ